MKSAGAVELDFVDLDVRQRVTRQRVVPARRAERQAHGWSHHDGSDQGHARAIRGNGTATPPSTTAAGLPSGASLTTVLATAKRSRRRNKAHAESWRRAIINRGGGLQAAFSRPPT